MVQSLHELIREVQKYADDLSKKIKRIRENEQQTQLVVQSFQECSASLNKAKDQYHNLCGEFDKLKRQLDPQQLVQYQTMSQQQTSASNLMSLVPGANSTSLNTTLTTSRVSQLVKVEKKMKQACDDYKSSIEKYNMVRVDYERKLADSCNQFQYAEEGHLKQMRNYVESYSKIVASGNSQKCQIMADLTAKMESLSSEYLISLLVENKRTGIERPEVAQFVESPVNTTYVAASTIDNDL
ncbi:proline-serine-threonine phosphatase interacting, partial [Brachionus plicatilis]